MGKESLVERLYKLGSGGVAEATEAADKIEQLWSAYCYSEAHAGRLLAERDSAIAAKLDAEALEMSHGEVIGRLRTALREVLEFQSAPEAPTIHDFGRWRRLADGSKA